MEAGAAVGLAAAIIEIVRCTKAICNRFEEIHSKAKDVPEAFKELKTQLPLIIWILNSIKKLEKKGLLDEDAVKPVEAVSQACAEEVKSLTTILDEVAPPTELSTIERARMVVKSLRVESKFQKSRISLASHVKLLIGYQIALFTTKQLSAGLDENNQVIQVSGCSILPLSLSFIILDSGPTAIWWPYYREP